MNKIKIALLDMNNNHANQGMRNITEISEAFKRENGEVDIQTFDVRYKNEVPTVEDFDVFISSGGPGNPHPEGYAWEPKFYNFLDELFDFNQKNDRKKFAFLICHSFQIASIHWKMGNISKRKSYSFGVLPIHKNAAATQDFLFKNLPDPFYAVDSRAYQFIEPNESRFAEMGAEILALEKMRPNINLERAVMAVRFSPEIYGTQFHPEANPKGMMENLKDEKNKAAMIENFGKEKYLETIDRIDDPDKINLTQKEILPRFLKWAASEILNLAEA